MQTLGKQSIYNSFFLYLDVSLLLFCGYWEQTSGTEIKDFINYDTGSTIRFIIEPIPHAPSPFKSKN